MDEEEEEEGGEEEEEEGGVGGRRDRMRSSIRIEAALPRTRTFIFFFRLKYISHSSKEEVVDDVITSGSCLQR